MEKDKMQFSKKLIGEVVSDKMQKTIVVKVTRTLTHPRFNKIMRRSKKYKVHDELEQARIGDVVEIGEGKPRSKEKYMYLVRVIQA